MIPHKKFTRLVKASAIAAAVANGSARDVHRRGDAMDQASADSILDIVFRYRHQR